MVETASPPAGRSGRFIVLEGGDGAGRSTQVRLLLPWLEARGWASAHAGLGRSALTAKAFRAHKRTREAGADTLALLYAADLHDQAAGLVASGLAAGFAVVADRWAPAAEARCRVRGVPAAWLRAILPAEPVPDLILHLRTPPAERLQRQVRKRGRPDFLEAGGDLGFHPDPLRGFVRYQTLLDGAYAELAAEWGPRWLAVDGAAGPGDIQAALRRAVAELLGIAPLEVADHV